MRKEKSVELHPTYKAEIWSSLKPSKRNGKSPTTCSKTRNIIPVREESFFLAESSITSWEVAFYC